MKEMATETETEIDRVTKKKSRKIRRSKKSAFNPTTVGRRYSAPAYKACQLIKHANL